MWAVGDSEIGNTPLDKQAWDGLIAFIRQSCRPLKLIWHRKLQSEELLNSGEQLADADTDVVASESMQYLELQKHLSRIVVKEKDALLNFMGTNQSIQRL